MHACFFVLINSVLSNLLCVWIGMYIQEGSVEKQKRDLVCEMSAPTCAIVDGAGFAVDGTAVL